KDIEARPNSLRMNRLDQGILIDNVTARSVDEVGAVFHRRKERFVDQHLSVGLQSDVYADDVRGARDIERRLHALDAEAFGLFRSETATPRDDRHAESSGSRNHLLSDFA